MTPTRKPTRRLALASGPLLALASLMPFRPALADRPALDAAIRQFTGGAIPTAGRVRIEIAELVENGNAVPVTVRVDSPMTAADHVRRIGLFNEKNPQSDVAVFTLGARAGRPEVATRIRLATSQQLVAVAETSDGRFWSASADVIVMLAACIE